MEIDNLKTGKVRKTIACTLVLATLVGTAHLPIIKGKSIVDIVNANFDKKNIMFRAEHGLPFELEKGLNAEIVSVYFKDANGNIGRRLDYESVKKFYEYNQEACKRQVEIGYRQSMFPWDGCEIIEEDGILMVLPIENVPKNEYSSELAKTLSP